MRVRPLGERIVVRRVEATEATRGGVVIPDTGQEKPREAVVVAVGAGRKLADGRVIPLGLHEGDRVLFGKYAGTEIEIDGVEHVMLHDSDILATL